MKINFHSEKFKKTIVWVMAIVLLPAFLIGGWLGGLFYNRGGGDKPSVKVFDEEVDYNKYVYFLNRWTPALDYAGDLKSAIENPEQQESARVNYVSRLIEERPYLAPYTADASFSAGLFLAVSNWIPGEKLEAAVSVNGDKEIRDEVALEVMDNLFARYIEAERMGLVPSEGEVGETIERWFSGPTPDGEIMFNQEWYQSFIYMFYIKYRQGRDEATFRQSNKDFHQTVAELIAIHRLEEIHFPCYSDYKAAPKEAAMQYLAESQQRKVDFVVADVDFFMREAQKYIADHPPEIKTEALDKLYHEREEEYIQPRRINGQYLLIDVDKLKSKITIDEEEIKKTLTEPEDRELRRYYDNHIEEFRRPPEAQPEAQPETPPAEDTPATGDEPGSAPGENDGAEDTASETETGDTEDEESKEDEYYDFSDVKEKVKEMAMKEKLESALEGAREKALKEKLDEINQETEDLIAAARNVDAPGVAAETFKDTSFGSVLKRLANFGKALAKDTGRAQLLPDLRPIAERHEEVTWHSLEKPISSEEALARKDIGGEAFAKLFKKFEELGRYEELKKYRFQMQQPLSPERRDVTLYLTSGVIDGADEKHKFIFRISEVIEPHLIPFENVDKKVRDELNADFIRTETEKRARHILRVQEETWLKQIEKGIFDFAKEAESILKEKKAYRETEKPEADDTADNSGTGEDAAPAEEPGFHTTSYFNRTFLEFKDVPTSKLAVFQRKAFALEIPPGKPAVAIAGSVKERDDKGELVDREVDCIVILRLTTGDRPVRKPSFREFLETRRVAATSPSAHILERHISERYEEVSKNIAVHRPEMEMPPQEPLEE
ncbi:MAG: hypothetical protein ABIH04_06300 [Planctomycetota bacterium]